MRRAMPQARMGPALRFEMLQALEEARERVAHGAPSLHAALHYLRLTPRARMELDRAVDDVRFDVPCPDTTPPEPCPGESVDTRSLREALQVAHANSRRPLDTWEDPGGLTRSQCVALLHEARRRVQARPVVSLGELFPHLAVFGRTNTT